MLWVSGRVFVSLVGVGSGYDTHVLVTFLYTGIRVVPSRFRIDGFLHVVFTILVPTLGEVLPTVQVVLLLALRG